MDDLQHKLDQLTPENLLAVFRALLLMEQSVNHFGNSDAVLGGQFVDPVEQIAGVGHILESSLRRGVSRKDTNIRIRRAA